ncbi:MAG: DEAD/DEAH box helicase family protein, partial [Pirellula staleyi]
MTDAKPFQIATVRAVTKAFRSKRSQRRFLVADEVGLGKTIVAREVIKHMMDQLNRPLKVIYVCSNLAIRGQNQD